MTTAYRNDTNNIGYVDPYEFDICFSKLYTFFKSKGFTNVHTQSWLNILAACEQPETVATFKYGKNNEVFPLPQTGQMNLEKCLMLNPSSIGFFDVCTSYRNEQRPIVGRHNLIFPLLDFETHGNIDRLITLEMELLEFLGYGHKSSFIQMEYDAACRHYGVEELEHEHEEKLCQEFGPVVFLKNFPNNTSPFWNMKQHTAGTHAYKVDVILDGQETIGSAERSSNVAEMRRLFHEISEGKYADTLYTLFGKERVEAELNEFFSLPFIERCGGGIGITRLIRSMKKHDLLR